MFGQDRNQIRKMFFDTWQKVSASSELTPLEKQIATIIHLHPEYHTFLDNPDNIDKDFIPEMGETNPYLHMGMHIAIEEQLNTQRPAGIIDMFKKYQSSFPDAHEITHQFMECLGETMWKAQREQRQPRDEDYMSCLKLRLKKKKKTKL